MIRRLLLIAAWSALALPMAAQKAPPVYTCEVYDTGEFDGSGRIVFGIARDGVFLSKVGAPTPADGMDGVAALCKSEIAKDQAKTAKPIIKGPVDLTDAIVTPPQPPDPALVAFQDDVSKLEKLRRILAPDDQGLLVLQASVTATIKAHPEYLDSI